MMRIVPFLLLLALPPSLVVAFQSVVVPRDVTVGATGAAAAARRQRHVAVVLSSTDNDDGDDGVENLNEGVSDVNTDTVLMVEDATVLAVDRNVETEKVRAREELMELAEGYQARYGVILLDPKKKQLFQAAVEKLEATIAAASLSATEDDDEDANSSLYASMNDPAMLVGDWTLVCSASYYPNEDKLLENPLLNKLDDFVDTVGAAGGPLRDIQATLIDSLQVIQKITCSTNDNNNNNIDAVDHIIDYKPPNTLSSFVKNLPDVLSDLDINPLKVKDTKIVLKHTAEIKQTLPNIDIKLILKSIVVNVAGESKNLEPDGADVLGINIPFGEYLNAGSFETTVVDASMRVSRSKLGNGGRLPEQIRVFRKIVDETDGSVYEKSSVVVTAAPAAVDEEDDDDDELAEDNEDEETVVVDVVDESRNDDENDDSSAEKRNDEQKDTLNDDDGTPSDVN